MPSPDTPGIPPKDVPRPDVDLGDCTMGLTPDGVIKIVAPDYAAAGRLFKWLMGQMWHARTGIENPVIFDGPRLFKDDGTLNVIEGGIK